MTHSCLILFSREGCTLRVGFNVLDLYCVVFQCFEQCFHAEGNGLPMDVLHTEDYQVSDYCSLNYSDLLQQKGFSSVLFDFSQEPGLCLQYTPLD